MAENYSLNSNFGFNIQKKNLSAAKVKETVQNLDSKVGDLFDSMTGYVAKYENVFNGDVEKEINMYNRQAMFLGMNLRAEGGKKSDLDINI